MPDTGPQNKTKRHVYIYRVNKTQVEKMTSRKLPSHSRGRAGAHSASWTKVQHRRKQNWKSHI